MDDSPQRRSTVERTALADTQVSGERGFVPLARGAAVGRYLVLRLVGEGAMGAVYAAYDPDLDRKVALKLLKLDAEGAEAARALLLREAQAMARLSHPGVVAVYDAGVYGEQLFVAMELVEGQTLTAWLEEAPRTRRELVAAFVQAGEGLAAAHAAGLVHRDFKPDNVLVDASGRVRVTDFGLAHADRREEVSVSKGVRPGAQLDMTLSGRVAGTPAYMAPEQFLGEATDARTDQFSFCVALFEALARTPPFAGDDFASLRASVLAHGPRMSALPKSVPAHLRRALARGMARKPTERFSAMQELLRELRHDPMARLRRAAAWGAPALVLLGAATGAGVYQHRQETRCGREAQEAARARWSPALQDGVRANLSGSGLGEAAVQVALGALDAHARDWADAQRQACEERRAGLASADDALRCLSRAALQGEALARRLGTSGPPVAVHTGRMLQRLRSPRECVQRQVRPAGRPWGPRPELQAETVDLQLAFEMGHFAQVLERTERLLPLAREEDPATAAALLELRGLVLTNSARGEEAVAAYRDAAREADRAGDDEASLMARVRMANSFSNALVRGQEGYEAAVDARAWLGRLGSPARLALEVEAAFCNAECARRGEASLAHCAKAVELAAQVHGPGSVRTADARNDLAAALDTFGQRTRAVVEYRQALEIYEADPFKQPFHLAAAWGNLAIAYVNLGRSQEAVAAVDAGAKYLRSLEEQALPFEAWLSLVRGEALEDAGQYEAAEQAYDRGLKAFTGDEEITRAELNAGKARMLVRQGRAPEALPLAREASQVAQGHPDAASRALCDFALAQAFWGTGEKAQALATARRALEPLRGPDDAFRRSQIERWLAGKGSP